MQITAAVVREKSGAFAIEQLELTDPRPDEALVRIVASGMCQTDLHGRDGYYNTPYPAVYGHEGAGVVEAVGASVTKFAPGDHVVISFPLVRRLPQLSSRHAIPLLEGARIENARHAPRWLDTHEQGRRGGLWCLLPTVLLRHPRHRQRTVHGKRPEGRSA
ncbi:MAG TPA: alcohol dehydrogenase catalytic domain-containing protein [Xanthobacteraceae bacterium]